MKEKEKRKFIWCGKNWIVIYLYFLQKDLKYLNNMQYGKKKVLFYGLEYDVMYDIFVVLFVVVVVDDYIKIFMLIICYLMLF